MGETGKRSYPRRDNEDDDKYQKKRGRKDNSGDDELVVYRILCPASVIGNVIGKRGNVINSLRQETRAKIKVVDPFPSATERVILIYSYVKGKDEKDVDEEDDTEPLCPAQDALLKVHSTIVNAVANVGESEKKQDKKQEEARILVPSSQVANVIGKSGSTIKRTRTKTKTSIKVIRKDPDEPTHSFAMSFDNIVQITGDAQAVKKALFAISAIMYKFSPREEIPLETTVPEPAKLSPELPPAIIIPSNLSMYPTGFYPVADAMLPPPRSIPPGLPTPHMSELHGYTDTESAWPVYSSGLPIVPGNGGSVRSEELVVRLLCPADRLGRVIGKAGMSIKNVRQETGARVEVGDPRADSDECVITVASTESTDDQKCSALDAVLLLQAKINDNVDDDTVNFRLLVPSKVIGCLIGKNGSIINDMRKGTKADVRISKSKKPKCAHEDDELVEVIGVVASVRSALTQIILRLREAVLRDREGPRHAPSADAVYTSGPHTAPATGSLYSGSAHSAPTVDSLYSGTLHSAPAADSLYSGSLSGPSVLSSIPPVTSLSYDHRVEAGNGMGSLSTNSLYGYESLQGRENSYGSIPSYSSNPYGRLPSTLEIVIPANAIGKVMGKGGTNIENIRKISGAIVEILESKSSRSERVAHISGTPEQKRTAENLIQAFILAT